MRIYTQWFSKDSANRHKCIKYWAIFKIVTDIRYDTIDDLHRKTDRQAESLI